MMNADFRKLNTQELRIIKKLFEIEFIGNDILKKQLKHCLVKTIDENGSLKFKIKDEIMKSEKIKKRIPVEAEANDSDGVKAHILLHVVGGKIDELEIYKEDSSRIIGRIKPEKIKVIIFK